MLSTESNKNYAKVIKWLDQGSYNCMVTLTFRPTGRYKQDEYAEKLLGRLVSRYMKATRPRKCKRRIAMAPILERTTLDEPHFHILLRLGDEDVNATKTLFRDIWVDVEPGVCGDPLVHDKKGDKWFKVIATPEDRIRAIEYVLKWRISIDGLVLKYTHLHPVGD